MLGILIFSTHFLFDFVTILSTQHIYIYIYIYIYMELLRWDLMNSSREPLLYFTHKIYHILSLVT